MGLELIAQVHSPILWIVLRGLFLPPGVLIWTQHLFHQRVKDVELRNGNSQHVTQLALSLGGESLYIGILFNQQIEDKDLMIRMDGTK